MFCSIGNETTNLTDKEVKSHLTKFLQSIQIQHKKRILILPPDYTRYHSQAGKITKFIHEMLPEEISLKILPALGTHAPMTETEIRSMFGDTLASLDPTPFVVHDWRKDVVTIGHVPAEMVKEATNGLVDTPYPVQLNRLVWEGEHDVILSIGQVVPHEVMGMANFNKNLFVGVGGVDAINLSHFIGAVYGMENMMGKADNPLRRILNHASDVYLHSKLPLWYILTVMGRNDDTGALEMRGLFIGDDIQCYLNACELSFKVNFTMVDAPLPKVVVYLDEDEFHSTWLGNKAIYRTRMALADDGELIILAPGIKKFGEDDEIDRLIRKYGYCGTPQIMQKMEENEELQKNLSAVAHLIHGSSEGRFRVTYCPGFLTEEEVRGVGYDYADLSDMKMCYDLSILKDGWNKLDGGEEFYYISKPALGLWALQSRFETTSTHDDSRQEREDGGDDNHAVSSSPQQQVANDGSGGVGGWAKPPLL